MIARNFAGVLPPQGALTPADLMLLEEADALLGKARAAMRDFQLHAMLGDIWRVVGEANRYFASEEPWKKKADLPRMGSILYVTAEVLRAIAILAQPAMPNAMARLLDGLGVASTMRDFAHLGAGRRLLSGTALPPPAPIFPRYVEASDA